MTKKWLILLMSGALFLSACNDEKNDESKNEEDQSEVTTEESDKTETAEESGEKIVEIGETVDVESFEWEVPYQITVKSVDFINEYDGEDITEYVSNADENIKFLVADTVIKNTSEEPMLAGEYVMPRLGIDTDGSGEDFIFELSEDELSQELAPGEEIELDFVYIQDLLTVYDPDGNVYLHFEGMTDNQKTYLIPTK
ncbi:hypothetical protein [Phocicoccus pinnipedialis]|uniref:Telomeric repeat-binding factor 2 n=1 Tax=Phocicoccus pinnipedialis TaxID=110845 RepID=A0A6V7R5E6_9BACL|nr:hypothetical protein [Jeotgalicoccus pinnipedialis]MBP1939671.1 hypothetical protein [Jeotgalicoccus pinnipedialis]CAD2072293.1 Telomeric repeat-binding factor 2 [Jeotgalicoccus pinnipedialis]